MCIPGGVASVAAATETCRAAHGPSVHVKTWLKPHERTSASASLRDLGMVADTVFVISGVQNVTFRAT